MKTISVGSFTQVVTCGIGSAGLPPRCQWLPLVWVPAESWVIDGTTGAMPLPGAAPSLARLPTLGCSPDHCPFDGDHWPRDQSPFEAGALGGGAPMPPLACGADTS